METTIRKKNIPSDKISKILSKKNHLHKISESLKYQIFQKYEDSNEILEILNDYILTICLTNKNNTRKILEDKNESTK